MTTRLTRFAVIGGAVLIAGLLVLPQTTMAAEPYQSCDNGDPCTSNYSCRSNPWAGENEPPGWPDDDLDFSNADRICCSLSWGCVPPGMIQGETGLGGDDPREIVARVINVILGFLGIIAVVLILAGGFIWMTAAGNDDKIATAKKIMSAGVIGLIIVLAAFGIAQFVVNALVDATTQT